MKLANWVRKDLDTLKEAWADFIGRIHWSGLIFGIIVAFAVAAFIAAPWLTD